jgi:O-antigen biosynthesis protein
MVNSVAWMIPEMIEGSGGLRTILAKANALAERGFICDYYFYRYPNHLLPEMRAKAERFFQVKHGDFYCGTHLQKNYDLAVATAWDSLKVVRDLNVPFKANFVQDYEAWFNPVGDAHLLSEVSFLFGLKNITLGKWLNRLLEVKFGERPYLCNFGVDLDCYTKLANVQKEDAVCFVYQPEKPRRCKITGIEALGIVKAMRPQTKIYFYGSQADPNLWYDIENLKLITPSELCELYNRVKVGVCLSSSNPSRIPFEMMACGLPVIDLYKSNNLYDYPSDTILLAHQAPESIAAAILKVLEDAELANRLSQKGLEFALSRPIVKEHHEFAGAIELVLGNQEVQHEKTEVSYVNPPYLAEVYAQDNIQGFCAREKVLW